MSKIRTYLLLFSLIVITINCVEEIDFETQEFESALVVEATFTTENIHQQVLLSRTFPIETEGPVPEQNAKVKIIKNDQTEIEFEETEPGVYTSVIPVKAQTNVDYQLLVTTSNGSVYRSSKAKNVSTQEIDDVFVDRIVNNNEEDGVAVLINTYDPSGVSKFYRFKYIETYKIIAPFWRPEDVIVLINVEDTRCGTFGFVPRPLSQQTCYATQRSNTIILANTTSLEGDKLSRFPVRFINKSDFIITHRYTALVKQFVISEEAYNFLRILDDLSSSESLFSQIQVGFIPGNIISESNPNEKVVGFFDVSFVSEKRVFFNFEDLFNGEPPPLFIFPCETLAPLEATLSGCPLRAAVFSGRWKFLDINKDSDPEDPSPFILITSVCGDCRELGDVEPPDFWIE